jgi:hypothetical protein
MGDVVPWVAGTGLAGALDPRLLSFAAPRRILFLLHGIKLLVNYFQFNSLEQNSASLISEFRLNRES